MIDTKTFSHLVEHLRYHGYADDDISWSEGLGDPETSEEFALEAIFVICNSGMKNTIARKIYEKCKNTVKQDISASTVFNHKGKAAAIDYIWKNRHSLFFDYMHADNKVEFCGKLPWIGPITKYHLAKNFGAQVAKPDVHLQRLADREQCTPQALCERLSSSSGYKIATVDVLLWRACAIGLINSKTGDISWWM